MASEHSTSGLFTADYHQEFRAETTSLLLSRFLWFTAIVGGMTLLMALASSIALVVRGEEILGGFEESRGVSLSRLWLNPLMHLVVAGLFGATFLRVRSREVSEQALLSLTYWLVIVYGAMNIIGVYLFSREVRPESTLFPIVFSHIIATAFLPWTWWQAVFPILVLAVFNAVCLVFTPSIPWLERAAIIALSPIAGVPGLVLCWVRALRRSERSRYRFLQRRYGEVRRELIDARKLHESIFPRSVTSGLVRMTFRYEPMRLIGGDFLFTHRSGPAMTVLVADVTGHGIPAALTVNRLYGELQRLLAEDPSLDPGGLMTALNRYAHLTLAPHSVYLTAMCVRVDPEADSLVYASAGHPPSFIRAVDGTIDELESTCVVLGACGPGEFDAAPRTVRFGPGDAVLIYTDGAVEARGREDRMLGIGGVRRLIASNRTVPAGAWAELIVNAVDAFRHGPPRDDTLVVEVYRPVSDRSRGTQSGVRLASETGRVST
ncbi:MAG: serine/threonine-protein phosphatase [Phycisphaeraceae bacterium]|nr:serine/threonine-protein phosphatase [Phycisphaeraceae bacterium]